MNTKLNHVVRIYVPSTTNVNQADAAAGAAFTDICLLELAKMFGGATALPTIGAWVSHFAGLVKEPINIVYAYCTEAGLKDHQADVIALASRIAIEMKQEAVSLEIDGELSFITAEHRQAA